MVAKLMSRKPAKLSNLCEKIKTALDTRKYRQSLHALQRMDKRKVTFLDILYVLENGYREESKDAYDDAFHKWKYAIRGRTLENVSIRVIITFDDDDLLIITVINLTEDI